MWNNGLKAGKIQGFRSLIIDIFFIKYIICI